MSAKMSVNRTVFVGCMVAIVLIFAATASASMAVRPFSHVATLRGPTQSGLLHLDAVISDQRLIGTLTVHDKDGLPWMGKRGRAYLLDPSGQSLDVVPLQPLAPGEFRLIVPLATLSSPSYLDIHLPGAEAIGVPRAVYRLEPTGPTVVQVQAAELPHPGNFAQSIQATGGPDVFGYTWNDSVSYNWATLTSPSSISLRDDDYVGPLNIGFTFKFYGKSYTQFYIDSNGFLSFADNGRSYYNYGKFSLPVPPRPNNIIAPFWEDFNPDSTQGGGGTIRYQAMGSSGSRLLVVEWQNVRLFGETTGQNVQVVLYETSNKIQFNYPNTRSGARGDLTVATVGVENEDGTIGLLYPSTIPINVNKTVEFTPNQLTYNVFVTPDQQGNSGAAGTSVAFHLNVRNLGANVDTYLLSYSGSSWPVSFYESNGFTPLPGNSTGPIASGSQKDIVARVAVPDGANVGEWVRPVVQATSSGNPSESYTAMLDVTLTPSFYQMYTDNYSGDGTDDSEIYVDPIANGTGYTRRLTTDQDDSDNPATAATPDGNAVIAWNTNYFNGMASVSEIEYAVVNYTGSFVRSIKRLTNNSAATYITYDFAPAIAVASNGNILIDWALQQDTNGDGAKDRYNARYTIVNSSGGGVKSPTNLTSNTADYPRDYPPSAVALAGGNFLLAWEHAAASGGPVDVYYAVLNSIGGIVKSPARLTDGAGLNVTPRVAAFPNGTGAIVWTSYNSYDNGEIYYAVVNADGSSPSTLTPITSNGDSAHSSGADAAALSNGQLAVAWTQVLTTEEQIQYTIVTGNPSSGSWITIVSEDFEGSFPGSWLVFDNDGTTNGEYDWAKRNCKPYAGSYSGWAIGGGANGAGLSCGSTYTNNVSSWMVYGPFSLADATAADLKFKLWLNSEPRFDGFWGTASINGANFYGTPISGTTGGSWVDQVVDLTNVPVLGNLVGQSNVWVGLIFASDLSITYPEGAYVDNIVLRKCTGGVCLAASSSPPISGHDQAMISTTHVRAQAAQRAHVETGVPHLAAPHVIYTVPNVLNNLNTSVSLTVDDNDRLILTWLDDASAHYVYYALASSTGTNLTPATILQRTRNFFLWSSWNGYGNAYMPPPATQGAQKAYLPIVLKDYPPPPENRVLNPGFESGLTSWTPAGSGQLAPASIGSPRHSGGGSAVLGWMNAPCRSDPHGDSSLSQNVQVPNSGAPTLSLWYRILSYDRLVGDKYDWFGVYINGALVWYTGRISSTPVTSCALTPADTDWQQFVYDLSAYAGQTVQLRLVNHTSNDWYNTWTYVDDVSVTQ
jgi:hypothetical protein